MMVHLSQTPPNMSSIGAVCDSLGKTFLTLLVGNLGATGGLRVNSSPVKGELIIFPLFLPEWNAILPMTAKAVCVRYQNTKQDFPVNVLWYIYIQVCVLGLVQLYIGVYIQVCKRYDAYHNKSIIKTLKRIFILLSINIYIYFLITT